MRCKKGVFFSTDAVIALTLVFLVLLVFYPIVSVRQPSTEIHSDVLKTLSSIDSGVAGKSALEYVGELYLLDPSNPTDAENYANTLLSGLDFGNENVGLWINDKLIWSHPPDAEGYADASRIETDRQMIFSLREGENAVAYSAFASLGSLLRKDYYYFGGYVGDGNVTLRVEYEGDIEQDGVELELAVSSETGDFEILVDGASAGTYLDSDNDFTPQTYEIPTNNFHSGGNLLEFKGENLHIAGGYLKITYDTDVQYEQPEKYYFPGIDGAVNIYDGFYVPGDLQSLDVLLHISSNADVFLNIGDVTVYEGNTGGVEDTITISDPLSDYSGMSRKTIPLRLGLVGVDYDVVKDLDVISVTDLSGSMDECAEYESPYICRYSCLFGGSKSCEVASPDLCSGNVCGGTCFISYGHNVDCSSTKLESAKEANNFFIDAILENANSRVGLVGYDTYARDEDHHLLSNDDVSLKSEVSSWTAGGYTCICCGINRAVSDLTTDSNSDNFRSMVVMSDGEANRECDEQGVTADLNNNGQADDAGDDAIQAACDAYEEHGIITYAVGFGNPVDVDQVTLQEIANCGNGDYFYSDIGGLLEAYGDVIDAILARYQLQTVYTEGIETTLYPDSYIQFNYDSAELESGIVFSVEKLFDSDSSGSFNLADVSKVLEARVTSYSGPRWTDSVVVNGEEVYDLSSYGDNYILLGDPFHVQLPVSSLVDGDNTVSLTTALSPDESNGGSESNKIIYKVLGGAFAYSKVGIDANGCTWTVEFENGEIKIFNVPLDYDGVEVCYYDTDDNTDEISNPEDAYQDAVLKLLELLDLDNNGKVDTMFSEQDLQISLDQVEGIPVPIDMEVQARVWY